MGGRRFNRGLKITEENVLPLELHLQMVRRSKPRFVCAFLPWTDLSRKCLKLKLKLYVSITFLTDKNNILRTITAIQ